MRIKGKIVYKNFTYFLCFSFLLSVSSFSGLDTEAREIGFPCGEMVLRGDVKFEAREKVWRSIESSHFPIFQKGKIKTEKGSGIITLANNCQIEVGQYSTISFDQVDRLNLSQGKLGFRIPSESEVIFKVGNLYVTKCRVMQAAKNSLMGSPRNEETVGSISLHSNGSVTVKSLRGSISVVNQNHVVLAALSARESITIPSITASGKSRTMVAQAGEVRAERGEQEIPGSQEWEYLGLNAIEWISVGYVAAIIGGLAYAFWPEGDKDRRIEQVPLCP